MPSEKPRLLAYVDPEFRDRVVQVLAAVAGPRYTVGAFVEGAVRFAIDTREKTGNWPWDIADQGSKSPTAPTAATSAGIKAAALEAKHTQPAATVRPAKRKVAK
jgi:hypothetical protein